MESRARDGKFILLCYTSISCQQLPDNKKMRTIGKTVSSSLLTYFSFVHVNLISQCFHFNFNISYFAKRKGSLDGKCSPFLFLLMSLAGSPDNINIYRVLINYQFVARIIAVMDQVALFTCKYNIDRINLKHFIKTLK